MVERLSTSSRIPDRFLPVWAAPDETFASLTIDDNLPGLELADQWLRVVAAGPVLMLDAIVARCNAARPTRWEGLTASADYPQAFERFLRKHRALVEAHMRELLIAREVAFGALRTRHQALLARRDVALTELDRVRAAAAHHRAFLSHHHFDAIDWGSLISRIRLPVTGATPVEARLTGATSARSSPGIHPTFTAACSRSRRTT